MFFENFNTIFINLINSKMPFYSFIFSVRSIQISTPLKSEAAPVAMKYEVLSSAKLSSELLAELLLQSQFTVCS